MSKAKPGSKVEIAYVIPVGREGRFTPKRKIVTKVQLQKIVDALVEKGARDFAYSFEGGNALREDIFALDGAIQALLGR